MMKSVTVFVKTIEVNLQTGPDIADITAPLQHVIQDSKVVNGQLSATMVGSTGSITSR